MPEVVSIVFDYIRIVKESGVTEERWAACSSPQEHSRTLLRACMRSEENRRTCVWPEEYISLYALWPGRPLKART